MPAKRDNTGLWVVAGIAGAALLYKKVIRPDVITPVTTKNYLSRIRVEVASVKIKGQFINFDIRIENPNEIPMEVKSVVGDVYVESNNGQTVYKLGNLNKYGTTVIKPNNETRFPFSIRVKGMQLFTYFSDLLAGKVHGQIIRFNGTININGRDYPVNETYAIA